MGIQRDISPDWQSDAICRFLTQRDEGQRFSNKDEAIQPLLAAGYQAAGVADRRVGGYPYAMRSFIQRGLELKSQAGRHIRNIEIVDPIDHPMTFSIWATLLLEPIPEVPTNAIKDKFNNTALDPTAITQAERDLMGQGILQDSYQIVLYFVVERTGRAEVSHINFDTARDQLTNLRDSSGNAIYIVTTTGEETLICKAISNFNPGDDALVVHDVDNAVQELKDEGNREHHECEGLEITDTRVGTVFQYYEWKISWEVRPIHIGACQIMLTKIPVAYSRITKHALYAYTMSREQVKHNAEKGIRLCLIAAALSTGIVVLVTNGVGVAAAAAVFGTAFFSCIEGKLSDEVDCFFSNLRLVAESSDWEEKVF